MENQSLYGVGFLLIFNFSDLEVHVAPFILHFRNPLFRINNFDLNITKKKGLLK
jgi:hypothetical protein